MTEEEKKVITKQVILAFLKCPKSLPTNTRLKYALDKGLNEAQKIIDRKG